MSEKKMKNIVRGMAQTAMIMCTAIAAVVFPSYAVEADNISSEGDIVLEDSEVALYADDVGYLANELNALLDEIPDEDMTSSVPVDYVRKNKVKSKGMIDYAGGTVVMNSADLIYIANEMDIFENTYKYMILKYLNDIHTYMTADGSVTHNVADSDASYFPTFGQLIKGISLSQEVNTGTTADNLSEGMGAWINGEYVTGNGNDVNVAYSKGETVGYQKGVADVVANPYGYGISASTLIDTVELYSSRQDFDDWTGYLTAPHDGTCTFIIKAGISTSGLSSAHDFTCSVYRGDTLIAYCDARDVYGDVIGEAVFKNYINYLELPNCTAGETLRIYIEKKGSDSTWIMGIA